ncbi:Serine/Threonine kinase domain protein (macronuclear) [Tetrahymena thermophila SB210]|uniref:Aurora kinase n=1 Tax=Tetrahymena thermophila (strain SB210) TaxID=312017 RepID=Q24FU4_TETTS|nr:Serine/Threonine kinase domain protein [Tetrahymena thermophila SB210]EAS06666.1 Serine/Threonine kinase domain protein [Tetrahymena thermophila SB210]|eukprot:XP_001026911.1 Serine/Threonine kinase domain protein [Tetrahymena thermophila SB210]
MQPSNNLTYVPYYQPLSSPKLPFQQGQLQQTHQFNLSKPTNTLSGQTSIGQTVFTSTTNVTTVFPTVNTLNYSNMPFQNSNALIHQKTGNITSSSAGNTNYLKSPILNSAQITATSSTAGSLQNSNLVNSIAFNEFQNNQNIQAQNQMLNSRNTRSPTSKGAGPLPALRSSSSKHSNEIQNDKQFDIKAYINKQSFAGSATFDSKPIFFSSLTNSFQPPSINNIPTSSNNITTTTNIQKQNNQNNNFEIQIINRNGFFEVNCESIHQQSQEILSKLKNKQLSLQTVKQLISEVKSLETKYSELYNKLCSNYEEVLMGKQIPQNKLTPTLGDIPQASNNNIQVEIEQSPSITITPIETENKILKINKIPQNLKFLGEYDPTITQPHTTTAAFTLKEDKKIPVIKSSNDVAIVLNEIKCDSRIQTTGNYEKIFKTETDEDPSDQYTKEEIKQRFLAINDNDTPQLLGIPGDGKKKISNSPKKYSFDVSNFPNDYQSSDEIERLIQQYRQNGMSKSANHEEQKQNQGNEGQKKPNTRGNSASYIKQESSEVQEENQDSKNTLKVVQNQQEKRKLSDIEETSRDNTAKKETVTKVESEKQQSQETQQQISSTTATAGSSSPGTNKSSKKSTTQDLLERVNNVLQRSDLFLMKHSDKKLKKGQSKNFNNVTADDAATSIQKLDQQQMQKEYDQSSEIKAIMDQIKRKSDYALNDNAQTGNQEKEVRQNLIIKFSEQSPKNQDNVLNSNKNRENRSISDYSAEKKKEQTRTSIQNLAELIKKSAENTPQSNQAVHGSAVNSEQNNLNSPQTVTSCQPISHEANQGKSTFSKFVHYTQNATQFGSFAFSSPKNTLGINELLNKYSSSVNNSPKTTVLQDKVDVVAEDNLNQEQVSSNQNSKVPSLVQSPQVLISFVSQASPAINLSESAASCKKEEKVESAINSQKNSQLKSQLSDSQSPAVNIHDSEKTTAFSPRNFQTHNNTTTQKTAQTEQIQIQDKGTSSQQLEIKQENLSSFARNIGQSGVFSPSSFSSNKSVAVQIIANNTEATQNQEEQPTIHPFLKQAVSQEPQSEKQNHENIKKELQESQNIQVELYEEIDPFTYSIENFKVGKKLGHGKFADVYVAVDKHTGFRVALKQIRKETIKEFNLYQDILNEIKVQGILSHPNIIKLYGFFIDNDSIYLIQELAIGKELFTELKSTIYKKFTENITAFYVRQVIEALIYMHSKNVVHRDLKPENIMVHNGLLKICDFGYAAIVQKNKMRSTFCGTLDYVSPEMVQGKSYDFSVDVWSVGILTYELLIGHAPFAAKSHDATFDQILNGELRFSGPISFEAGDFISRILEREPNSRMNLTQALQHPFIQNEYIRRLQSEKGGEIDFADFNKL